MGRDKYLFKPLLRDPYVSAYLKSFDSEVSLLQMSGVFSYFAIFLMFFVSLGP